MVSKLAPSSRVTELPFHHKQKKEILIKHLKIDLQN